jgi:hypothetical protein
VDDIRQELMELNEKMDDMDSKFDEILGSLTRIEVHLS